MEQKKAEKIIILNTKKVEEIDKKEKQGYKLSNHEKLWFKNIRDVRKANIPFQMTDDEIREYVKSKLSVNYFAEKYCQIKREDGSVGPMHLRDYQKDIINLYTNNRFSILMASRQTGKCLSFNTLVHIYDENNDIYFNIMLVDLYYLTISQDRKLSFLEKTKWLFYKFLNKLIH